MAEPILEVRSVSKSYVGVQALNDVSLTVQAGEVHCLVGENGSGKSTLIKTIGGAVAADSGEIMIDGVSYGSSVHPLDAILIVLSAALALAENKTLTIRQVDLAFTDVTGRLPR
jgi:ABC-type sugar transport system ATPase subunit